MNYEVKQLEDDSVAVWLVEDPSIVGWVSSWHLVEPKANQLIQAYEHRTGCQDPSCPRGCREDQLSTV